MFSAPVSTAAANDATQDWSSFDADGCGSSSVKSSLLNNCSDKIFDSGIYRRHSVNRRSYE